MKPVMPKKCMTCPFGPKGDARIRAAVMGRLLTGSQMCHSPRLKRRGETHLCRGARDEQLRIMHRLGVIAEETDAAWEAAYKKLKL
jgi:hypothetical protein